MPRRRRPPRRPASAEDLELPGGRVRGGSWVPTKRDCPHPPQQAQPPPARWTADGLHRPYDNATDFATARAARLRRRLVPFKVAARECDGRPPPPPPPRAAPPDSRRPNCSDASLPAGVRLVVGVHTAPSARARREAIRKTWLRWPSVGTHTMVCFLLGRERLAPSAARALRAEAAEFGDIALLEHAADECILSIPKSYAWWLHAARWLGDDDGGAGLLHVAKVDDDSFVHVPNLEEEIRQLACHDVALYGLIAHAGFSPIAFNACGFNWSPPRWSGHRWRSPWHSYKCAENGYHYPIPFATGALQVMSAGLVRALSAQPGASRFIDRAARMDLNSWHGSEDVAVGFLLSRIQQQVSYVGIHTRKAANLGCYKHSGLYFPPKNNSVVVHFVKKPYGMNDVWGVLHGHRAHDPRECKRAAGVD
eukprot:5736981-Prymnesium_polylepis.3